MIEILWHKIILITVYFHYLWNEKKIAKFYHGWYASDSNTGGTIDKMIECF